MNVAQAAHVRVTREAARYADAGPSQCYDVARVIRRTRERMNAPAMLIYISVTDAESYRATRAPDPTFFFVAFYFVAALKIASLLPLLMPNDLHTLPHVGNNQVI